MRTMLLVVSGLLFAALGCSNEPTSNQFKEFAEQYASKISGETVSDSGEKLLVKAELAKFNLEKTPSLTVPFVGTAEYLIEVSGVTARSLMIENYATPAICFNRSTVKFGWIDGKWQAQGGESIMSAADYPSLPDKEKAKLGRLIDTAYAFPVSETAIEEGRPWVLNNNFTTSEKAFDETYLKPRREILAAQQKAKDEQAAIEAAAEAALPQTLDSCLEAITGLLEPVPGFVESYFSESYFEQASPGTKSYLAKQELTKRLSSAGDLAKQRIPELAKRSSVEMIGGKSVEAYSRELLFRIELVNAFIRERRDKAEISEAVNKVSLLIQEASK